MIVAWNWPIGSSLPAVAMGYVGGMVGEMTFVPLPGDYNQDRVVDAADYEFWRAAFGSTTISYAGADGNGDGIVDAADYTVWRDHLGSSVSNGGASIPFPSRQRSASRCLRSRWHRGHADVAADSSF